MKLKSIDENTIIYARPDGCHYHLDRNCPLLQGEEFKKLRYAEITKEENKSRDLSPCACAFDPQEKLKEAFFELMNLSKPCHHLFRKTTHKVEMAYWEWWELLEKLLDKEG